MLIQTRYIPPTNTKGGRVKAWAIGRSFKPCIVGFHDSEGCPHQHAARTFAESVAKTHAHSMNADNLTFYRAGSSEDERGFIFAPVWPVYRSDVFSVSPILPE